MATPPGGFAKNVLAVVRLPNGRVATELHAYDVEVIADKPIYSCAKLLDRHRSPNYIRRFAHAILNRAAACIVVWVGIGGVIAVD